MVIKELVQYIAQALVDIPEEVSVNEIEGRQITVFELKVAKSDLGKFIGKQGRTAQAVRTILGAGSARTKKRVVLEIIAIAVSKLLIKSIFFIKIIDNLLLTFSATALKNEFFFETFCAIL
jgi:predicted RNA-binding protein YlqC (UPF0109 family)